METGNSGFLTTADVAKLRGVKRGTVSKWCRTGVIPRQFVTRTSRDGVYRIRVEWLDRQELYYGPTPGALALAKRDLEEVMRNVRRVKSGE